DLQKLVQEGKFRLDLYYRISPITIEVPPLRKRLEDIPALVAHFIEDFSTRHRRPPPEVSECAIAYLMEQSWPGNVRQLRHEVERAIVFAEDGRITSASFGKAPMESPKPIHSTNGRARLRDHLEQIEADLVRKALERHNGNKKRVAQELGISRSYLYKVLNTIAH